MAARLKRRRSVQTDRFFDAEWYAWQHPDIGSREPLQHFLEVGCEHLWDPSPFVDLGKLLEAWHSRDAKGAYLRLCSEGADVEEGVYRSPADLIKAQEQFRGAVGDGTLLRTVPPEERRRNLVFLQNRRSRHLAGWMSAADRSFDVWVNYYDPEAIDPLGGDWVSTQIGTKFTAIPAFYRQHREVFDGYDHIWLLDDDVSLTVRQIDTTFHAARVAGADLAQPSLSHDSHCMWPALRTTPKSRWRNVSTVEIMMPIYSRRLAITMFPQFIRSVSGFGLDLLSGYHLAQLGGHAIVIDEVVARHEQQIDQTGGEYYQFLRRNHINANAELWVIAKEFDLPLGITELGPSSS